MKKFVIIMGVFLLLVSCSAQNGNQQCESFVSDNTENVTEESVSVTEEPESDLLTDAPESVVIPEETLPPLHSELFIPGLDVEDVINYFNEVCLDGEIINGGDPSFVQKRVSPIKYSLNGEMTEDDKTFLNKFCDYLNTIDGFPGISYSENDFNLRIYFCNQDYMKALMSEDLAENDGAVTFWYDNDIIYDAIICYRTDIEQSVRNSVIIEEIYNGLGPIQDTSLREDSIIYSGYSTPQWITEIDELIIKLLYNPKIKCGMNSVECESVIRELYY